MGTFWNAEDRAAILARIDKLTPEAQRRWGKMNVGQMVAHLSDQMRVTLGEIPVTPVPGLGRTALVRNIVIYWLPWPKGRIQGPKEGFLTKPAEWDADMAGLRNLVDRFAESDPNQAWPEHPLLGPMTGKDWGVMCYKHFNHHLTQFGV